MVDQADRGDQARARRVTRKLRDLRFDAGSRSLDLIATVARRGERPLERLDGTERLAEWFARSGLPVRTEEIDDGLLSRVRVVREAMYGVVAALLAGRAPAADDVAVVNAAAAVPTPAPLLAVRDGRIRVEWPPGGLSGVDALALLARDLLDLLDRLGDEAWRGRLRACTAADCRMIYLDTSQGRRRQWCSMEHCGNRVKAAKHRAHRAHPARHPAGIQEE